MTRKKWKAGATVVGFVALTFLIGCSNNDNPPSVTLTSSPTTVGQIELTDYRFQPSNFMGGGTIDPLTFRVHNSSINEHTFTINELGVDYVIGPGETVFVDVPLETGHFVFYCRFHKDLGMQGSMSLEKLEP